MQVEPVKDAADRMDPRNDAGGKCYFDRKTGGSSWDVPDEMRQGLDTPSAVKASRAACDHPNIITLRPHKPAFSPTMCHQLSLQAVQPCIHMQQRASCKSEMLRVSRARR